MIAEEMKKNSRQFASFSKQAMILTHERNTQYWAETTCHVVCEYKFIAKDKNYQKERDHYH